MLRAVAMASCAALAVITMPARPAPATLHLETFVADSTGYDVVTTLVAGPTEAIVVDVQGRKTDAARIADQVASRGLKLKAIFITHGHDDHFIGLDLFLRRFPGTPVYMAPGGLREFTRWGPRILARMRRFNSTAVEAPDSLETPALLPSDHFSVDGQDIEVVPDRQGDALITSNSYLWIPSLRAIIAGDIVFNNVHPYLASSTPRSRAAWLRSLNELLARHPAILVAGPKPQVPTSSHP